MGILLAPCSNAMRLGQGFNSYTQEICIDDAVLIDPGRDENVITNDGMTMSGLAALMGRPSQWNREKEIQRDVAVIAQKEAAKEEKKAEGENIERKKAKEKKMEGEKGEEVSEEEEEGEGEEAEKRRGKEKKTDEKKVEKKDGEEKPKGKRSRQRVFVLREGNGRTTATS